MIRHDNPGLVGAPLGRGSPQACPCPSGFTCGLSRSPKPCKRLEQPLRFLQMSLRRLAERPRQGSGSKDRMSRIFGFGAEIHPTEALLLPSIDPSPASARATRLSNVRSSRNPFLPKSQHVMGSQSASGKSTSLPCAKQCFGAGSQDTSSKRTPWCCPTATATPPQHGEFFSPHRAGAILQRQCAPMEVCIRRKSDPPPT